MADNVKIDHKAYKASKEDFYQRFAKSKARKAAREAKVAAEEGGDTPSEDTPKSSNFFTRFGYIDVIGGTITDHVLTFVRANQPGTEIIFPGFVTSYADNFSQVVNKERVFGRSDPLHTYEATERTITFSWVAPAASEEEAANNLHLINSLVKSMYPDYRKNKSGGHTITTSALMGVSFHGLAHGNLSAKSKSGGAGSTGQFLYGYIENLSIDHDFDAGVFDLSDFEDAASNDIDAKAASSDVSTVEARATGARTMAAKAIRLNVTFTPVHPETLGFDEKQQFISTDQFPYQGAQPLTNEGFFQAAFDGTNEGPFTTYTFEKDPKKKALFDAYQAQRKAQEEAMLNPQNPWSQLGEKAAAGWNGFWEGMGNFGEYLAGDGDFDDTPPI